MIQKTTIFLALLAATATAGCQFHARSPADYEKATHSLVETKKGELKACYDELLKKDAKLAGLVQVKFTVEAETGAIKDARVDEEVSTAPSELGDCVIATLNNLKLDPPDKRDGVVTWSYDFKPNPTK